MNFKWFLDESKKFMRYGTDVSRVYFWMQFPFKYLKFEFLMLKDNLKGVK